MTFFSTAEKLEIAGVPFTIPESKPTRREALAYFRRVVREHQLDVRQYEEVAAVTGEEGDFTVRTRRASGIEREVHARAVVIATGGFAEPNWLGVPGERLPKVLHYYREPYPFYDQDVLVVGGRNSAVESTLELYRNGARVTMVHFEPALDPGVKPWVIPDITNRVTSGEIPMYFRHRVAEVRPETVLLREEGIGRTVELVEPVGARDDRVALGSAPAALDRRGDRRSHRCSRARPGHHGDQRPRGVRRRGARRGLRREQDLHRERARARRADRPRPALVRAAARPALSVTPSTTPVPPRRAAAPRPSVRPSLPPAAHPEP